MDERSCRKSVHRLEANDCAHGVACPGRNTGLEHAMSPRTLLPSGVARRLRGCAQDGGRRRATWRPPAPPRIPSPSPEGRDGDRLYRCHPERRTASRHYCHDANGGAVRLDPDATPGSSSGHVVQQSAEADGALVSSRLALEPRSLAPCWTTSRGGTSTHRGDERTRPHAAHRDTDEQPTRRRLHAGAQCIPRSVNPCRLAVVARRPQ